MKTKYDIAAYIWPAYTGKEPRTRLFWEEGIGEWQTVKKANAKFEGHSWPRKPLLGYEDEADPAVMEKQIELATSHGVNVFIYDWYWFDHRPFLENCLNDGFLKAPNNEKMRFYLMWANHDANYTWDLRNSDTVNMTIWEGACNRLDFDTVCDRVISRYFTRPNYYTINACPVFNIYDIDNLIKGLGGIDQTRVALQAFRDKVKAAGFPELHLQLTSWGEHMHNISGVDSVKQYTTKEIVSLLHFDSVTNYQFVHFVNIDRDYDEILADVRKEW
ncbi:MAG: glycoside hydrolase family 99-like domain-containing protein, partial [Clostridia bacterium]|nr:glycoside hydrolase family 99-like domain-containing protein [Clostridia bacterium]